MVTSKKETKEEKKRKNGLLTIKDEASKNINENNLLQLYKNIKSKNISLFLPFKYLRPFHKKLLILSCICSLFSGSAIPFFISVFGSILKNVTLGDSINKIILSLLIFGICQFISSFISSLCMNTITNSILKTLKLNYLRSIFYQDGEFHDKNSGSKLISDLDYYLTQIKLGVGTKFVSIFTYLTAFFGTYIWSLVQNYRLTLAMTCVFPVIYIFGIFCNRKVKVHKNISLMYNNNTASVVEEALVGIRTVASYCAEKIILKKFELSEKYYSKYELKANFMESIHIGGINAFIIISYAIGFWYGTEILINEMQNNHASNFFDGGSIISIVVGVLISMFMLTIILPNLNDYMRAIESTIKINEVINRKPAINIDNTGKLLDDIKKIQFKNVKFRYSTRDDVDVYNNMNFVLEEGKTYAFVGESGCGKSTILKLIERLYDPTSGNIIINDEYDLKDLNVKWWRSKIGVVTQDPFLFSNSIRDNIKCSLYSINDIVSYDENKISSHENYIVEKKKKKNTYVSNKSDGNKALIDSQIINVSKKVLVHEFVNSLPNKYDTLIGSNASKLSGGQKQRISIARAVIRNPKILILDEATSSLDNKSEYLVQKTINNLQGNENRITIIIAHRLSTIRYANTIFVLSNKYHDVNNDGENKDNENKKGSYIVEQGDHETLMKNKDGIYYNMIKNQKVSSNENMDKESEKYCSSIYESELQVNNVLCNTSNKEKGHKKKKKKLEEKEKSKGILGLCGLLKRKKKKKKSNLDLVYKEIFSYKKEIIITFLSILAAAGIYPLFSLIFANYINILFDVDTLKKNSYKNSIYMLFLSFGMFLSETIKNYFNNIIGQKVEKNIKYKLFENILHQEINFFDQNKNSPGILLSFINRDVHLLKVGLVNNMIIFSHFIILFIISMIIAFYYCPILAAVLTVAYFISSRAISMRTRLSEAKGNDSERGKNMFLCKSDDEFYKDPDILIQEACYNISTIINYGLENHFISLIDKAIDYTNRGQKKKIIITSVLWGISQCTQMFINSFAYWLGSILINNGLVLPNDFMSCLFAFLFSGSYGGRLMAHKGDGEDARMAYEKYYPLLIRKSNIDVRDNSGIKIDKDAIKGEIEISNVNYRYITRPKIPVYNDLSFICESKKTTAIVGETGSGKSTFMSLLLRLYDLKNDHVILKNENSSSSLKTDTSSHNSTENEEYMIYKNEGEILLDGVNINLYNLYDLRNMFSTVSQDPMLFNMSIYENIKIGKQDATLEDVKDVCKFAAIEDFIESLPDKYDTNVGPFGKALSGGQKQRIAIARALIRDPKILLLDEATSSLDSISEQLIEKTINDIKDKSDRTIISIAHRISSIKRSDKIIVFNNPDKNGTYVQAQGTHNELLSIEDSIYKKYVKLTK